MISVGDLVRFRPDLRGSDDPREGTGIVSAVFPDETGDCEDDVLVDWPDIGWDLIAVDYLEVV